MLTLYYAPISNYTILFVVNQENSETCTYSIMPDERSLNSQHSHNFSNNKIDVILEEAEEYIIEEVVGDNQDRIASNDIENKESR